VGGLAVPGFVQFVPAVLSSDFHEYTPAQSLAWFDRLTERLPKDKVENVRWRNLAALFED
jgi:hypothetical protein